MLTVLKNTTHRLVRTDVFTLLTGSGLSAGVRLLTFALLARWLPRETFGEWVLFQTYYTLFDTVRTGFQSAFVNQTAGADDTGFHRWTGAAWQLALAITAAANALLWAGTAAATALGFDGGGQHLVAWFGVLSVVTLPNSLSDWVLYARQKFRWMQAIKLGVQVVFLAAVAGAWYLGRLSGPVLYAAFIAGNGLVSVFALAAGWSRLRTLAAGTGTERIALWRFGRYSTGTLIASNLLRSSDTLLLGALLGPAAVVTYHVPQRIIELIEMPIRSTVMASVPKLAALFARDPVEMALFFQKTAGRLWVVLLPFSVGCFLLAEPLVVWLGGAGYRESAGLLRIFMVYTALMPLERYGGIGLDAVRQPRLNLLKVGLMLAVNVAGDLVALLGFQSVTGVALASIGTFLTGLGLGYFWLGKKTPVTLLGTVRSGLVEARSFVNRDWH